MKGRVEGIVDNGVTGLQDVAVRVSGKYYSSTDTMGYYTILQVPSGTHTAYAYAYGYILQKHNNNDQSIGIVGGQIFTANFTLTGGLMSTGWIEGFITLELTDGFCDVVARLNPSFDSASTDSEGYYLMTGVSTGSSYYVHGEKANYSTVQPAGPIAVNAGVGAWADLVNLNRCTGTIDGYITDSQTLAPISGAVVILSDMNRNDQVPLWYPGSDYYTDYVRSKIYQTTTDSLGYYQFTDVPWSDANTSGLNKTWAWTVVMIKTGYAVGVSNAAVVCGSTSTVSFTVDPLCAVSGFVTFDILCASSATITATQIAGGTEGSTEFGWSSNGVATVTTSGGSYYIGHLHPGAYDVTAAAGSCSMISPTISYTGAYAVPLNYRTTTTGVDFGFGILGSSGSSGSGSGTGEGSGSGTGEGSGTDEGSGTGEGSGTDEGSGSGSGSSPGEQEPQESQQERTYQTDKLLLEVAQDAINQAKALKKKVYDTLAQTDDVPDRVEELLAQADSYLEKALEFFGEKDYAAALLWAEKAIHYYKEILQLLT
jgi:hypothetical protein